MKLIVKMYYFMVENGIFIQSFLQKINASINFVNPRPRIVKFDIFVDVLALLRTCYIAKLGRIYLKELCIM